MATRPVLVLALGFALGACGSATSPESPATDRPATASPSLAGTPAPSSRDEQPTAAASGPAAGRRVFIDDGRQSSLSIDLGRTSPDFGQFSFAVADLGLFFGDEPASVEFKSGNSVVIRYDGAGTLDRGATLDFVFNITLASGAAEPASIRLEAQVDLDRVTSSAQLRYEGVQYELVDDPPPSDPSTALGAILAAMVAQDWPTVYDLGYSGFRDTISRDEFAAQMSAAWAGLGTATATAIVEAPRLGYRGAGFDVAKATVSVTFTKDGVPTSYLVDVTLIYEPDGWKFISLPVRS